ncbi:MAG: amino acid permease [Bacteroidales bacterium]|nr:amino acid permease [Bacteroidales bacterium]
MNKLGVFKASAFVIANMIGTGVFTSLGFQLLTTSSPFSIAIIWIIGGLTALCGATVYSELGTSMPHSGGEYYYLSKIYHPILGFISGWTSLLVGFAAPIALTSMAMTSYVGNIFQNVNTKFCAVILLTIITLIHCHKTNFGTNIQSFLTIVKILIIIIFIAFGFTCEALGQKNFDSTFNINEIFTPNFAISLIWVYYAYSGWNAAAYIADEIKNPQKNIPLILLCSTITVVILYLLLNMVFLRTTPIDEIKGQIEIGLICAKHIFGPKGGNIMGGLIAFMLISCISSMVFVGARIGSAMGEKYEILKFLTKRNKGNAPVTALLIQWLICITMIVSNSFQIITQYVSVVLSLCAFFTVLGTVFHRLKNPYIYRPYKTWAYPLPIIVFCTIILWSIIYVIYDDFVQTFISHTQIAPWTTILSCITILSGTLVYFLNKTQEI